MAKITVKRRNHHSRYIAYIDEDPDHWAGGANVAEAIGQLLLSRATLHQFGIPTQDGDLKDIIIDICTTERN